VIWRAGHGALVISLPRGVKVDTNDLGGRYHRKVTTLRVPEAVIKVLLAVSSESNRWLEAAEIIADAFLDIYASPHGHRDMTRAQAAFVEEQDRLTNRARRMFLSPRSHGVETGSSLVTCMTEVHFRTQTPEWSLSATASTAEAT
jgi:hypothetical protein